MNIRKHKFEIIIFLIALVLRLSYGLNPGRHVMTVDGQTYDKIAVNMAEGEGFSLEPGVPTPVRAPFYSFFLASIYSTIGRSFGFLQFVQSVIDSLSCVLLFMIVTTAVGKRAAVLSAILYATYLPIIPYSHMVLSEVLFIFLLLFSVVLIVQAIERDSAMLFGIGGFLIGLSALTRGTTTLLPLIVLVPVIANRVKFAKWLLMCFFMIVSMAPWTVRNYINFNKIIPICTIGPGLGLWSSGYAAAGMGTYEEGMEKGRAMETLFPIDFIDYEKKMFTQGVEWIKENPAAYAFNALKKIPRFWWTSHSSVYGIDRPLSEYRKKGDNRAVTFRLLLLLYQGTILALAAAGMLFSLKTWKKTVFFAAIIIYFTGHVAFDPCNRFHLPAIPFVLMFASMASLEMYNRINSAIGRKKGLRNRHG
ncbi:MAG: glycosyltransferase family 39 protein [Endomicrobiales bacterium]|nr:glycosyltransferase family 39 protein [Endomicrobiales bacterium]